METNEVKLLDLQQFVIHLGYPPQICTYFLKNKGKVDYSFSGVIITFDYEVKSPEYHDQNHLLLHCG